MFICVSLRSTSYLFTQWVYGVHPYLSDFKDAMPVLGQNCLLLTFNHI